MDNTNLENRDKITTTIMLSHIYNKIRKRNKGNIIKVHLLKQIIRQSFIGREGSPMGINKIYLYDIIQDMINFSLIKKINQSQYEVLNNKDLENTIIKGILKKIDYLKSKILDEEDYKYRLKKISERLDEIIIKVDKNSEFQIINNNCEKRLKHFPF